MQCLAWVVLPWGPVLARDRGPVSVEPDPAAATVLEEVEVEDDRLHDPVRESPARATNRITREDIRRSAPKDLYEALQGQPGVVIEGGPRTQGKRIVIRGFSDNEDVLVRVDGATQNFEKYRYGTGVDIDPNLIRQVDVLRGASTLTQGSGALGGAVLIETLDASDLLQDDERWGMELRLAHGANDRSEQRIANFYARPLDWLDVLVSQVSRMGEDFRLPSGQTLANSSENVTSALYKLEVAGNDGGASLLHREGSFAGLQPLDATGGGPGVFGNVRRETRETSQALEWEWNPITWINLEGSLGQTQKNVTDRESQLAGGGDDFFDFDILTLDLRNRSEWSLAKLGGALSFGLQGTREERDTWRVTRERSGINLSQPPGVKLAVGGFIEHVLDWEDLRLTGALRIDRYQANAEGPTANLLRAQGEAEQISFVRSSPGAGIEYVPGGGSLTLFYDWFEAFRPPLIDEFFTAGAFSRCQLFRRYVARPRPPPGPPQAPQRGQFPPGFAGTIAFTTALNAYLVALNAYLSALDGFLAADAAWPSNPLARVNAICGDAYVPEEASNHEIGASWLGDGLLREGDHLFAKLTFYRSNVRNTLQSIFEDAVTGEVSQPGIEQREGMEFELNYETGGWRLGVTGATIDGFFDLGTAYFTRNSALQELAAQITAADVGPQPLFDIPGDTLQVSLLRRWGMTFEAGYRIRANGERLVVVGARPNCPFILPVCNIYHMEPGFVLHTINAAWNPDPHVSLQITVDNLTDFTYRLPGFMGGVGATAPGRSATFTFGVRF